MSLKKYYTPLNTFYINNLLFVEKRKPTSKRDKFRKESKHFGVSCSTVYNDLQPLRTNTNLFLFAAIMRPIQININIYWQYYKTLHCQGIHLEESCLWNPIEMWNGGTNEIKYAIVKIAEKAAVSKRKSILAGSELCKCLTSLSPWAI
jgi:hypothetical protein